MTLCSQTLAPVGRREDRVTGHWCLREAWAPLQMQIHFDFDAIVGFL